MSALRAEGRAREIIGQIKPAYPIDVDALAQACAVAVERQDLEEEVSGILVVKDKRGVIAVNSAHHPHRQRFTIAHELGHYLLHREASSVFIDAATIFFRDKHSAEGTRWQEIEANAFAAELLMPAVAITAVVREHVGDHLLDEFDDGVIRRLAAHFGVSIQALTVRLVRLGLMPMVPLD